MANYAQNTVSVQLNSSVDNIKGDEIISEFQKIFGDVEIYNENCDTEIFYGFNADFDWKWSAPIAQLTDFCRKYNATIIGTSIDLYGGYVESFTLPKDENINTEQLVYILYETDLHKTKKSRVCLGIYETEDLAISAYKKHDKFSQETEIEVVEANLNKFHEI